MDWATLNKNLIEPLIVGKTGNMFSVASDLIVKVHSKTRTINVKAPDLFAEGFKSGKTYFSYIWEGEERFAYVARIKNQPWIVGISITTNEIFQGIKTLMLLMIITSLIAIAVISISILIFIKSITKPLDILVNTAKEIADGDLRTTKQKIHREDEFGELSNAFVAMRKNLVETIRKVELSAKNIAIAAKELSDQNTNLSNRTESQAETSASMSEIASTIRDSAESSVAGSQMILDSRSSVEKAGNIIGETT